MSLDRLDEKYDGCKYVISIEGKRVVFVRKLVILKLVFWYVENEWGKY